MMNGSTVEIGSGRQGEGVGVFRESIKHKTEVVAELACARLCPLGY